MNSGRWTKIRRDSSKVDTSDSDSWVSTDESDEDVREAV